MIPLLSSAWQWLAAFNIDLPWTLVAASIFALVYAVRKLWPSLWLRFEALSPVKFPDDGTMRALAHKVYQALPSLLLGGVMTWLATGDWRKSLTGVLVGIVPPLAHEFAAWLPVIPYKGAVAEFKEPPSPDDTVRIIPPPGPLLVLFLLGLAVHQQGCATPLPIQPDVCSKVSLATIVAGCDTRAKECTPGDTTCSVYLECKKAVATWRDCR